MLDPMANQLIDYPYSSLQYLENLPAYDCNSGVNSLLDLFRELQESGNYYWQGLVFPSLETVPTVPAQGTISGTVIVPPGTYITGISASAIAGAERGANQSGFNLKIYDKGSKASIFYSSYAQHYTVTGAFGTTENVPTGPALLKSPFIITGPGVLGWEIVNLATVANQIQVMLDSAVPITNRSIGNVIVNR